MAAPALPALLLLLTAAAALGADSAATLTDQPIPAVIKFFGIQHGYANDTEAQAGLADSLSLMVGREVVVDEFSMENGGVAVWRLAGMTGCDEATVRQVLALIRDRETGQYTRAFKMHLGPEFMLPRRLEVEWRGPCENLDRKRTLKDSPERQREAASGDAPGQLANATLKPLEPLESITTAATPEPVTLEDASPPSTTTEQPQTVPAELTASEAPADEASRSLFASDETATSPKPLQDVFVSMFDEPADNASSTSQPSTTTTGAPTTTVAAPTQASSVATASPGSSVAADALASAASVGALPDASPTTTTSAATPTTTTTTTPAAGSTNSSADPVASSPADQEREEDGQDEDQSIASWTSASSGRRIPEAPADTSSGGPAEKFEVAAASDGAKPSPNADPDTDIALPSADLTLSTATTPLPTSTAAAAASSPHYGKYIGLTTGFFVFIAYLLCARAYRRQGMYELQEST